MLLKVGDGPDESTQMFAVPGAPATLAVACGTAESLLQVITKKPSSVMIRISGYSFKFPSDGLREAAEKFYAACSQ